MLSLLAVALSLFVIHTAAVLDFTSQPHEPSQTSNNPTRQDAPTFDKSRGSRYLVLHLNTLGFANRIRTVADFYTMAVYSGRTLLLSWVPSVECNTTFTELFESGPEYLKVLSAELPRGDVAAREYVQSRAKQNHLSFADYDASLSVSGATATGEVGEGDGNNYFASAELFDSDVNVVYTTYWGSTALRHLPCQHFMISKSKFYQALVPVPSVTRVVNEVKKKFDGKVMIGVHVRGFDAKYDWAVVPPSGSGTQATSFGETLPLSEFMLQMHQVEGKYTRGTMKRSAAAMAHADQQEGGGDTEQWRTFESHKFFVATNDRNVKEAMRREFPTSVSLEGEALDLDRNNPSGMIFALIEWLVLAQADLLLHTYGSSFALEAAHVHRRPIVGLWTKDVSIYYHDERLPLCGHMQFLKEFMSDSKNIEYEEGTVDKRKIRAKSVALHKCGALAVDDWGLSNLYCSTGPGSST